jgi:hypothetical protein
VLLKLLDKCRRLETQVQKICYLKSHNRNARLYEQRRPLTSSSYIGAILRRNVLPLSASKLHGVTSRRIHFTVIAVSQNIYLALHFTQEQIRKNGASFRSPDTSVVRPHARHSTVSMNCVLYVFARPDTYSD